MDFWTELIKSVISNGIFASLFVFLFFYQLKDSEEREDEYIKTIEDLSNALEGLEGVKDEIKELTSAIKGSDNEKN